MILACFVIFALPDPCSRQASDCVCSGTSKHAYNHPSTAQFLSQQCMPGSACFAHAPLGRQAGLARRSSHGDHLKASIVLVMDFDPRNVRPAFLRNPWGSYYLNMLTALRLILSLKRVGTRLPITLIVSGERKPEWEALFVDRALPDPNHPSDTVNRSKLVSGCTIAGGVSITVGRSVPTPPWANLWHRFAIRMRCITYQDLTRVSQGQKLTRVAW